MGAADGWSLGTSGRVAGPYDAGRTALSQIVEVEVAKARGWAVGKRCSMK